MKRLIRGGKRGDEIVEATIVLPLVILAILSMILLLLYFFACLQAQLQVHKELLERPEHFTGMYKITRSEKETNRKMEGLARLNMAHTSKDRLYLMNAPDMVRIGEVVSVHDAQ